MSFCCISIDHKTADTGERNRVAFTLEQIPGALSNLLTDGASEALILSTCNRTEIYANSLHHKQLINWLANDKNISLAEIDNLIQYYYGEAAFTHAVRVASGLESIVMGEPQILGQMKKAFAQAQQCHAIGKKLHFVFQKVLMIAKDIRFKTELGHCPVSVAFCAVKLLQQQTQRLDQLKTLIIGAGDTAALTLKHLQGSHNQDILVANRTLSRAQTLAKTHGVKAISLEQIADHMAAVDLVITATASSKPLITKKTISSRNKPLYLIDLSVPHNIAPAVAELAQVHLHTIDDIKASIQQNTLYRTQAALKAEELIKMAVLDYRQEKHQRDAKATVCAMREQLQALAEQELQQALIKLDNGENPSLLLKQLSHNITQKWLHHPTINLKQMAEAQDLELLKLTHKLFNLAEH